MVVVVKIDEFPQTQMPGQRSGFLTDAFHQVAVAADRVSVVIHNLVPGPVVSGCQPCLSDSHADPVGEPLPKGSGSNFDPWRFTALGMPWRFAAPLSETFDLLEWQVISSQVEQAVQQHRPVS